MFVEQSEQVDKLFASLAKAQSELNGAKRDRVNTHFKSEYATLASMWAAWQQVGPANGLAVIQAGAIKDGQPVLVTMLCHSSGQWLRGYYPLISAKMDPQGLASATTYARRNCLAAMTGLCPVDDDGECAQGREKRQDRHEPDPPARQASKPAESPYQRFLGAVRKMAAAHGIDPEKLANTARMSVAAVADGPEDQCPEPVLRQVFAELERDVKSQTAAVKGLPAAGKEP